MHQNSSFRHYHNIDFRISKHIARSLLKNKAVIIFIRFLFFFQLIHSLALRCSFPWKSAFYSNKKNCNWKTIYCFFLHHLHKINFWYFFSVVMREKKTKRKEWMKISAENFVFYWMGKNQFPLSTHTFRSILMLCNFLLFAFVIRDVDLIRWKKILRKLFHGKSRPLFSVLRKSNFSLHKMFYSATENEHLTNWDRIQWQLTQFVNQFPLHALNIRENRKPG